MHARTLEAEILKEIAKLPEEEQNKILSLARALAATEPTGGAGRDLLVFAGSIPQEDLEEIKAAIEEGCEQVREDDW